jgi:hypothetical protein
MLAFMSRIRKPTFSDEQLLSASIHLCAPDTPITPAEAGTLLGKTVDALRSLRRDGKPPKFKQDAGPRGNVYYPLGEVLAARKLNVFQSSLEASRAHKAGLMGYPNFAAFLLTGSGDDEWVFTSVGRHRRPVDLLTGIQSFPVQQRHGVHVLTLQNYLSGLRESQKSEALAVNSSNDGQE